MDELLEKFGVNFEDLRDSERETLMGWMESLERNQLTVSDIKNYVHKMKEEVEQALADEPEYIRVFIFNLSNRNQILLKARLRNYILLESFLDAPERARKSLENAIKNIKPAK